MNMPLKPSQFSNNGVMEITTPDTKDPQELLAWSVEEFSGLKVVMTTAFGMEGCALIDMYSRVTSELTVAYIDTGFFFPETRKLIDRMSDKYSNVNLVKWESPVSIEQQREKYGNNLWKDDSELCCKIRKVIPMKQNIYKYDVWTTAIRKSQTKQRSTTSVVSWDPQYEVIKFCPMADLTRVDVWNYIQEHDVPFNQLHTQGYPSIGCFYCTRAVPNSKPTDDTRAGRWQGHEKTECGLHF